MYNILCVDDEPDLLEVSQFFLEESGEFRVDTASSPAAALELLTRRRYDGIISDYQMPGMDGIAFLRTIRERYGDLPFILFTGRGDEVMADRALRAGIDFYQRKYGDPEEQFAELICKTLLAIGMRMDTDSLVQQNINGLFEHIALITPAGEFRYTYSPDDRIMGYPATSLVGRKPADFIHPDDIGNARKIKDQVLSGGSAKGPVRLRFRAASGRYHMVEADSFRMMDIPQVHGILVASHDCGPCD